MRIKKLLNVTIILMLLFCSSYAAKLSLGFKGGLNLSRLYGDEDADEGLINYDRYEDQVSKPGVNFGGMIQIRIDKFFALQPELMITTKGERYEYRDDFYSMRLSYIEAPMLFKLLIPAHFVTPTFFSGPALAFRIGKPFVKYGNDDHVTKSNDDQRDALDEQIKRADFGIVFGTGVGFKAGPGNVIIDLRYTLGLVKIYRLTDDQKDRGMTDDDLPDDRNSTFSFSMGYMFAF